MQHHDLDARRASSLVDFSLVTFVDGGSILTGDGDAERIADFGGKRIAVIQGTTTERALRDGADARR